jgi:hypothetical protein
MIDYYVYFIGPVSDSPVYKSKYLKYNYYPFKVGVSSNPTIRLKQLQTACFVELEIIFIEGPFNRLDAFQKENELHKALMNIKSIGEWFHLQVIHINQLKLDIQPLIKNDLDLLTKKLNHLKSNADDKDVEYSIQLSKFRWDCWMLCKNKEPITYKAFWKMIDTTDYYPLKKKDRILIILQEFQAKSLCDIVQPN